MSPAATARLLHADFHALKEAGVQSMSLSLDLSLIHILDKAALLEAGAAKVELVADDEQLPEAVSSSLFEKFDSRRIRELSLIHI